MLRNLVGKLSKSNKPLDEVEVLKSKIDPKKLPVHVAIIMDGNGRWAVKRGLPRGMGHRAGVESLRKTVEIACELGVKYLTVYAFSTENWKRPQEEVNILMDLLLEYLRSELKELIEKRVCIRAIGDIDELPQAPRLALSDAIEQTKDNDRMILNLCLNYGGRREIVDAVKNLATKIKEEKIAISEINEKLISEHLYTQGIPDPDLLIRPAGELRISNYLLWQLAYSEFWLTDVLWPDFREKHFLLAVHDYQKRHRRFGGL